MSKRRFGWVRQLPSGRYQASYLDPRTGKRVPGPTTYKTKTAADHWLVAIEADLIRGELLDLSLGRMTFAEWAEHWLQTRQIRRKTFYRYEGVVRNLLIPAFGFRRINTINRNDVVIFISSLVNDGESSKAADARSYLSMIFGEAVRSNAIRLNPADGVRVKRRKREEMIFLTRMQAADLADAISVRTLRRRGGHRYDVHMPQYGLMVRFVTETGLRAGEIAALRVGRVDTDRRRVEVAETVAEVSKEDAPEGMHYDAPKNYERRSVPIPPTLAAELAEHLKTRPADRRAFVFTSPKGEPLRHTNFYDRIYKPAVLKAGLPPETRFHDLRHTYAALLIAAGANPLTVKQRMGHSSITVTMDRYGHLFPHLEEEITERMEIAYLQAHANRNSMQTAREAANEEEASDGP